MQGAAAAELYEHSDKTKQEEQCAGGICEDPSGQDKWLQDEMALCYPQTPHNMVSFTLDSLGFSHEIILSPGVGSLIQQTEDYPVASLNPLET